MKEVSGDLLEIKSGVILHQVNCIGITGGLAGALRRKYPNAFKWYAQTCRTRGASQLGSFIISNTENTAPLLRIAHIFGQVRPGPHTDLVAVDKSLGDLVSWLTRINNTSEVFAPFQIGCGLGGGHWPSYKALLVKHIPDIIIVRKFNNDAR